MKKLRILLKKWILGEWQKELRGIKGSSTESSLSFSFALGVFIGFTPTIGFQTALCYSFARLLKKSFLVSLLGSFLVTGIIPLSIPVVYYLGYRVGCNILNVCPLSQFPNSVNFHFLFSLGKPLIIGSLLLELQGACVLISLYLRY